MDNKLRPIKLVLAEERDYRTPDNPGGSTKIFTDPTTDVRRKFVSELDKILEFYTEDFRQQPPTPAIAKVKIREEATAKSHRPNKLFNNDTCPIVQTNKVDELLISVTPTGLQKVKNLILADNTIEGRANISVLESLTPFYESDRSALSLEGLSEETVLKVKLFDHHLESFNTLLEKRFESLTSKAHLQESIEKLDYGFGKIYKISKINKDTIKPLLSFPGIQTLSLFPSYSAGEMVDGTTNSTIPALPAPITAQEYPLLGIIDSGISDAIPSLKPWIVASERHHPPGYSNYAHGSFVAGLIAFGPHLNSLDPRIPYNPCKIVDIQALSSDQDGTAEYIIRSAVESAINKYPSVRVWNLSFGSEEPCDEDKFSDLAQYLDRIQKEHDKIFIISAGNYETNPLRRWPSQLPPNAKDRISIPADSALALTVGSVAHKDSPTSAVRVNQPSPFSRKGPGPSFIPKPDLVHYGGNCTEEGALKNLGLFSFNENGRLVEAVGTSYSSPITSALVAHLDFSLGGKASRPLLKALAVHSARMQAPALFADHDKNYHGFGLPGTVDEVLYNDPWAATLIFEANLAERVMYSKPFFPIPDCLTAGGKFKGEVFMTMIYDPPLDGGRGAEYIRCNVDVTLGKYYITPKGNPGFIGLVPQEEVPGKKTREKYLIKEGYKWSPAKVYHKKWPEGTECLVWGLNLKVTCRNEFNLSELVPVAVVVTIRDPEKKEKVYDGVVAKLQQSNWLTQDIQIRDSSRLRI